VWDAVRRLIAAAVRVEEEAQDQDIAELDKSFNARIAPMSRH
jgi:hypothetical protein